MKPLAASLCTFVAVATILIPVTNAYRGNEMPSVFLVFLIVCLISAVAAAIVYRVVRHREIKKIERYLQGSHGGWLR